MRVVSSFDEFKDRHARFDRSFEMTAVEQFAFESGEENFRTWRCRSNPYRAHRRPYARLIATLAKG
jgi:hypothetical protein